MTGLCTDFHFFIHLNILCSSHTPITFKCNSPNNFIASYLGALKKPITCGTKRDLITQFRLFRSTHMPHSNTGTAKTVSWKFLHITMSNSRQQERFDADGCGHLAVTCKLTVNLLLIKKPCLKKMKNILKYNVIQTTSHIIKDSWDSYHCFLCQQTLR